MSLLAGIGFTVSLLIGELAFGATGDQPGSQAVHKWDERAAGRRSEL